MQYNKNKWSQFFTEVWASEMLFETHFSHLTANDLVFEPSCGNGSMLSAIPKHIPAIGNDIDPVLSKLAHENTGRIVHNGDFRTVQFEGMERVTAMFGNPPFELDVFEGLMQRFSNIMSIGNKAGFLLPCYFLQTADTFMRFARNWYMDQKMIPRNLFKGLSKPLMFATFIRENNPEIHGGFQLYAELCDVNRLKDNVREIVATRTKRNGSVWREAVISIMQDIGGKATLDDLYNMMEKKRPTENSYWREKVRQVVQAAPFKRIETGTYILTS